MHNDTEIAPNKFFLILLFVFLYNVPFTNIPISGSKIVVLLLMLIMFAKKKQLVIEQSVRRVIVIMLVLIAYSVLNVIVQGTYDFSLVYAEFLFLVDHLLGGVLFFSLLFSYGRYTRNQFLEMVISVMIVQAVIIVLSMVFPPIYTFIDKLAYIPSRYGVYTRYGHARGFGLASSIVYDLSVIQSFGIMIIVYLLCTNQYSAKRKRRYYFGIILLFVSVLLTGRTGLVGVFFAGCIFVFYRFSQKKITTKEIILYCSAIMLLFAGSFYFMSSNNAKIVALRNYVLEGFGSSTGNVLLRTGSGNQIFGTFFGMFKELELKTWIFGDARFLADDGVHYYRYNDLGVFRDINYFGIIGCIILLFAYITIIKSILRKNKEKYFRLFVYLSVGLFAIAHFKGEFLLSCDMAINIILFIFISYSSKQHEKYSLGVDL